MNLLWSIFFTQYIQCGQSGAGSYPFRSKGAGDKGGLRRLHDVFTTGDRGDRVAVARRLSKGSDVGLHLVVPVKTTERPAKARGALIKSQNSAPLCDVSHLPRVIGLWKSHGERLDQGRQAAQRKAVEIGAKNCWSRVNSVLTRRQLPGLP